MRTTLEIEDDVLLAAKELAARQHTTAGKVISQLVRRALTLPVAVENGAAAAIHGFRPFPSRGSMVTNEMVNRLRDEEGV
jgi:hypothetical protein